MAIFGCNASLDSHRNGFEVNLSDQDPGSAALTVIKADCLHKSRIMSDRGAFSLTLFRSLGHRLGGGGPDGKFIGQRSDGARR